MVGEMLSKLVSNILPNEFKDFRQIDSQSAIIKSVIYIKDSQGSPNLINTIYGITFDIYENSNKSVALMIAKRNNISVKPLSTTENFDDYELGKFRHKFEFEPLYLAYSMSSGNDRITTNINTNLNPLSVPLKNSPKNSNATNINSFIRDHIRRVKDYEFATFASYFLKTWIKQTVNENMANFKKVEASKEPVKKEIYLLK
jgi:hypothetical protein